MTLREFLMHRKIGWLAIIGPVFALLSIWVCIIVSPWFTWQNNAISDFGVHSVAPLFNSSLIICGILCAIFALGVILRFRSIIGKIGMSVFFLACVSLVGIGVFHENLRPYHFIFSVAFFVLLLIATLVLAPLFLLKRKTRLLGISAMAVTVLGIFGWAYHVAVGWGSNVAIPEAMTFVPGGIWFMMLGVWVLGKDSKGV
ncbi:MAG: DUF998 domain-containing protein [Thermoplasmata archaeon]